MAERRQGSQRCLSAARELWNRLYATNAAKGAEISRAPRLLVSYMPLAIIAWHVDFAIELRTLSAAALIL